MRLKRFLALFLVLALLSTLTVIQAQDGEYPARVKSMSSVLNVRQYPTPQGQILVELTGGTSLSVLARTYDDGWVMVKTENSVLGWVASGYLDYFFDFENLPQIKVDFPGEEANQTDNANVGDASPAMEVQQVETVVNGAVRDMGSTLRMRTAPNLFSPVIADLKGRTPLNINGRNGDWLYVRTESDVLGWVSAEFIDLPRGFDVESLPIIDADIETSPASRESDTGSAPLTGNITGATAIYLNGKTLGNRANVFAKIGDSITVAPEMFDAIGRGIYNLGQFSGLETVISHFNSDFNSFTHVSASAGPGWTSETVLNPQFADASKCAGGVPPIQCEYDRIKPAIALIMLGTNDMQYMNADEYAFNMNRIVEISKANGVIPVLSTIPHRDGYGAQVTGFNTVIRNIAASQNVPLWDYNSAMGSLPNLGLSGDGMHPSIPSGGYQDSANFTGANLTSGYVIRNLTALQVLDSVWRSSILGR